MKKFTDAITIIAFFSMIVMIAVASLLYKDLGRIPGYMKDEGSVLKGADDYLDDCFPLKNNWRSLYAQSLAATGRIQFDNIFIAGDRLIKVSDGSKDDLSEKNINNINRFVDTTSTPVYVMLAPTAAGVYSADLPAFVTASSQKDKINSVYMQLDKRINSIDAYYPLYSSRNEYVFYRTEDLWTSFGAYYAYCESVKPLGIKPMKIDNYDQEYAEVSFTGSLFSKVMYRGIAPDRINIFRTKYQSSVDHVVLTNNDDVRDAKSIYFNSALSTPKKTDIFLLGDTYEKIDITTELADEPKLLIIKGSFANTIVPFYTNNYSEIVLCDPVLMKQNGHTITDLVDPDDFDRILIMFDIDSFTYNDLFGPLTNKE